MVDGRQSLSWRLIRLAAPVAAGRMGVVMMGVTDMIVVGQFAARELAWQSLGWTLIGPALHGGIGLLLGVQVLAARAIGAGEAGSVGAIWRRGVVIGVAAGLLVCALAWSVGASLLVRLGVAPALAERGAEVANVLALSLPLQLAFIATTYRLEAMQRPLPGAVAMWAANGVNLALNLAFVPHWGAIGSAWATVLARAFLLAALAGYVLTAPSLRAKRADRGATSGAGYDAILAIGIATAASALIEAGTFATMSVIAGRIGPLAVATFAIATGGLVTLAYLLAQGFAAAGVVLVSDALGRDDRRLAARIGVRAIGLTLAAMALCGGLCWLFRDDIARAFSADARIGMSLVAVMGLVALLMIPDGGQGVADALLRAYGQNWRPTLVRITPFVLVAPPLALWLGEHEGGGVAGVLAALVAASVLALLGLLALFAAALARRRIAP